MIFCYFNSMLEEINQLALTYLRSRVFSSWDCKEFVKYGDIIVDKKIRFAYDGHEFIQFPSEFILPQEFTVCRFYRGVFIDLNYWPTKKVWFNHIPHRQEIISNYNSSTRSSYFMIGGKKFYIACDRCTHLIYEDEDRIRFKWHFEKNIIYLYTRRWFDMLVIDIYKK